MAALVDIGHLPVTDALLLGREAEIARLDDAWAAAGTRVVTVVGQGGEGKTALVNAWLLYRGLRRDGIIRHSAGWSGLLAKCLAANVVMVLCLEYLALPLDWWLEAGTAGRTARLAVEIGGAVTVYFAMLYVLGIRTHTLRLNTD